MKRRCEFQEMTVSNSKCFDENWANRQKYFMNYEYSDMLCKKKCVKIRVAKMEGVSGTVVV